MHKDDVRKVARDFGLSDFVIVQNNHIKLTFRHMGRTGVVVASHSPGGCMAEKQFRRDVKRTINKIEAQANVGRQLKAA